MPAHPTADPTQSLALRSFTTLYELREDWGGALVLSLGLNLNGAALAIAANVAGAVSLTIEDDPSCLREATRSGAVDFTVNTLDEALRAIKNEIRKHAPLSVALNADPALLLDEILERGLAPQLFSTFLPLHPRIAEAAAALNSIGAVLVDFSDEEEIQLGFQSSRSILAPLLEDRGWTLETFTFESTAALRSFDTEALALLPSDDNLRRRWLQTAPRILQRQRPPRRTLWVTESENAQLKLTIA